MKKKKFPISLKIALMVIVFVVITTAVTSYYRIVEDEAVQKQLLHEQMKNLANIVADIRHTQPVSEMHVDWILWQDFVDRIITYYDNIIYIAVFNYEGEIKAFSIKKDIINIRDEGGNIIDNVSPDILVNAIEKETAYIQGGANIINIRFETSFADQYGRVSFCYSEKMINDRLYESKIKTILLAVNIVILGVIISLFFSRRITRSIKVLLEAIQEIAKGKFPDRIKVYTNDEISTLSENFNEMNKSLYYKNIIETFSYELTKKTSIPDIVRLSVTVSGKVDTVEDAGLLLIEDENNLIFYSSNGRMKPYFIDWEIKQLTSIREGSINPAKFSKYMMESLDIFRDFLGGHMLKITTQTKIYGFILLKIKQGCSISQKELDLFYSIIVRLSFAIENFLLNQKILEQEVYKRELEIASRVQNRLLPEQVPSTDKYDMASTIITAKDVGGDYYDFFRFGDDRLYVLISDVSGKGTSASFYMALLKGVLLGIVNKDTEPVEAVKRLNNFFFENTPKDIFISLIFGVLMDNGRKFSFVRAGHCPLMYYSSRKNSVSELKPRGIALGAVREVEGLFELQSIELEPGDFILLYTDGVSEAMNKELEEYGEERLKDRIQESADKSIDLIIKDILYEIWQFREDYQQNDDIAMVGIRIK